ncbi:MAG: hypothetical protein RL417_2427 [Pseudomonadota bacterium]|jgi:membrane protease YdiL (CAAX protease family)
MTRDPLAAPLPRAPIVRLAVIGEGLLFVFALAWIALRDIEIPLSFSLETLLLAGAIAAPLAILNLYLFLGPSGPRLCHPAWRVFSERLIQPLCAALSPGAALLVSVMAGVAEETAFRGLLLTELRPHVGSLGAVVVSGIVFGWVHFLGMWREFFPVLAAYCLFGILLGAIYLMTRDLVLLIVIHTIYDFWVIVAVHRKAAGGQSHPLSE